MGKFIVIEGLDCTGKHTQALLLKEVFEKRNEKVIIFSFPNYDSPTGKIIGGPFLGRENISEGWFPETAPMVDGKVASLLYAADRRYNLPQLKKYIDMDYIVILDRYIYSNMAYQASKVETDMQLKMIEDLEYLEFNFLELPKPDIILYLEIPIDTMLKLNQNRSYLDENEKNIDYLKNVYTVYEILKKRYSFVSISCVNNNCLLSKETISKSIIEKIL